MRLVDQHIVVTGAASGIGLAMAQECAAQGARVTCLDLRADAARAAAESIGADGGSATHGACDITHIESVQAALDEAVARFGKVDALLANAGGAQGNRVPFLDLTTEQWEVMITRNLTGPFNTGKVFASHMASTGGGSIVFTTSQSSAVAVDGLAHYTSAKAGVTQLVRSMASELAQHGVRVNAVAPGATLTPGNEAQLRTKESEEFFRRVVPMGRVARPAEITGAAIYLACAESSYTTGTTIVVDGGYTVI